jgi:glycine oxidase
MKNIDYIIVGQGIAGSVLAEVLQNRGQKVIVVDNHHFESSSQVAAGLYNPVVFRVFSKSFKADEFFPCAKKFFADLSKKLKVELDHKRSLLKIFTSAYEQDLWQKEKSKNHFLGAVHKKIQEMQPYIEMKYGCGEVPEAGYVNLPLFLAAYRNYLAKEDCLINEKIELEELKIFNDHVVWKNYHARKIIFCEGHAAIHNSFFNYLPFKLTKGETLDVSIGSYNSKSAVNKGVFVLPLHDGKFKVGATHSWDDINTEPTEEGKNELTEKLKLFLKTDFEILKHTAGIRPTVIDRRPYLGLHPRFPALCIFNGLGTKGVLMAPYLASHLADFLLAKVPILEEVNISRHEKRFHKRRF